MLLVEFFYSDLNYLIVDFIHLNIYEAFLQSFYKCIEKLCFIFLISIKSKILSLQSNLVN